VVTAGVEQRSGVSAATTPSLLDRYEAKYLIPMQMIDPIVQFIKPWCSYDKHSALSEDRFYKVNSLYFDTPDFLFLRQRLHKAEKRFNMRIRSYGDAPIFPYFFEIKQRLGDIIRKIRAEINDPGYADHFHISSILPEPDNDQKNNTHRDLFYLTASRYNARPVVLVQYRRQAFFSNFDDYARVTFDIDLRFRQQDSYDPIPVEEQMYHCQSGFNGENNVVLELKCCKATVPAWMIDLIRTFQLKRQGFSKYSTCLKSAMGRNAVSELLLYHPSKCDSLLREVL